MKVHLISASEAIKPGNTHLNRELLSIFQILKQEKDDRAMCRDIQLVSSGLECHSNVRCAVVGLPRQSPA
jgi:hypothetical protein